MVMGLVMTMDNAPVQKGITEGIAQSN